MSDLYEVPGKSSEPASAEVRKEASVKVRNDFPKVRKEVRKPRGEGHPRLDLPENRLKAAHRLLLVKVQELQPNATLTNIARALRRPISTVDYNLKNLLFSNYVRIDNPSLKTYLLAPRGKEAITNFIRGSDEKFVKPIVRAHDVLFKAAVQRFPTDEELTSAGFSSHDKMKGWQRSKYFGVVLEGVVIEFTTRSLMMLCPEVYGESPDEAKAKAWGKVKKLIEELKKLLPTLSLEEPYHVVTISRQSFALVNDEYARLMRGLRLSHKDERIEVDSSKEVPEMDFVHPASAQEDCTAYLDFIHQVVDGEVQETLEQIDAIAPRLKRIEENEALIAGHVEKVSSTQEKMYRDFGAVVTGNYGVMEAVTGMFHALRQEIARIAQEKASGRDSEKEAGS
ncbi:MAG: hypothetical protein V1934_03090 [Methanobacteriota archaeon]